jgi:hypothetical protein
MRRHNQNSVCLPHPICMAINHCILLQFAIIGDMQKPRSSPLRNILISHLFHLSYLTSSLITFHSTDLSFANPLCPCSRTVIQIHSLHATVVWWETDERNDRATLLNSAVVPTARIIIAMWKGHSILATPTFFSTSFICNWFTLFSLQLRGAPTQHTPNIKHF